MLIPSTDHPSSIPAWIKIHKLPLECWTEAGLSRIASSIGKPIHVDNATAKRQRLDFARVCVEIEAGDELPTEVQVIVNGESVVVHIEYQWLPSNCTKCKIFGHSTDSCTSKISHVPSTSGTSVQSGIKGQKPTEEEWQVIGRTAALEKGGITALEAVTKFVPITSDTSLGGIKSDVPLSDNESETPDEEFVVDSPPAIPELTAAMAKEVPKIPQPPNSDMEDSTWVVDPGINKAIGTSQGGGIGAATSQPNSSKSSSSSKKKKNNKRYSQGSNQGVKNLDLRVNSAIIEDNKMRKIEKQKSGKVGKDIKKAKKVGNERMTIGAKCVELLIEREVVLFYTKDKDSEKFVKDTRTDANSVHVSKKGYKKAGFVSCNFDYRLLPMKFHLPMICPPEPWV